MPKVPLHGVQERGRDVGVLLVLDPGMNFSETEEREEGERSEISMRKPHSS